MRPETQVKLLEWQLAFMPLLVAFARLIAVLVPLSVMFGLTWLMETYVEGALGGPDADPVEFRGR